MQVKVLSHLATTLKKKQSLLHKIICYCSLKTSKWEELMLRVGGDLQNIAVKLGLRAFLTLWLFSNCWVFFSKSCNENDPP